MATESIMTPRPTTLRESDTVAEALPMMHASQPRDLPVVEQDGPFVGMFAVRRPGRLLLPKAARLGRYSLADRGFVSDDIHGIEARLKDVGNKPVFEVAERKKLVFCILQTTLPELLQLFDHTRDAILTVIVVSGKRNRLGGMVCAWDVPGRLTIKVCDRLAEKQEGASPAKVSQAKEPAAGTEPDTVPPQH
jgi:hypothetical protein